MPPAEMTPHTRQPEKPGDASQDAAERGRCRQQVGNTRHQNDAPTVKSTRRDRLPIRDFGLMGLTQAIADDIRHRHAASIHVLAQVYDALRFRFLERGDLGLERCDAFGGGHDAAPISGAIATGSLSIGSGVASFTSKIRAYRVPVRISCLNV